LNFSGNVSYLQFSERGCPSRSRWQRQGLCNFWHLFDFRVLRVRTPALRSNHDTGGIFHTPATSDKPDFFIQVGESIHTS
jgi:hypothetical protein